jgi:hypothetical protein
MADFATVAELEQVMGPSGLGARGTAMLGYASAHIRRYVGQELDEVLGRQEEYAADADERILTLTERPVNAVTAVVWSRYGTLRKTDWSVWDEGPIVITYDSGYPSDADEMQTLKAICIEMVARAMGGVQETFGSEVPELRPAPAALFLSREEERLLDEFRPLLVA